MRALRFDALVRRSSRIAIVTALASECHFEELGRRRRIVTDTRVRVEEHLAKGQTSDHELMVRTLGGSVGDLGEVVHGQPRLALGEPSVAFLLSASDGVHYVNGMAQGHFPLSKDGVRRLLQSPELPKLLDYEGSAVKALAGTALTEARSRIRAVGGP